MKKLMLDVPGIAKLCMVMDVVPTIAVMTLLFLGCHTVDLVGITSAYSRYEACTLGHLACCYAFGVDLICAMMHRRDSLQLKTL